LKVELWDDMAFTKRVKAAAQRRGMTVAQALKMAGVSAAYLKKPAEGRGTNTVLNLARVLDVPPVVMFGLEAEAKAEPSEIDSDRLERITVVARMMAAQLAALVYVAAHRSDVDPAALMEMVLRKIDRDQQSNEERDGNGE
jgi:transcriptional regulator with XRE-family HTH domain